MVVNYCCDPIHIIASSLMVKSKLTPSVMDLDLFNTKSDNCRH